MSIVKGFSLIMLVFGVLILLAGIYIFKGHNSKILLWKGYNENTTKSDLKIIGKWTMITSIIPFILSIIGLIFDI